MIPYLGDYTEDQTVYVPLNTFSSDDPSASVTITNLADADIKVHKDGSTTQIVTDGATVAIDFDSITGNHLVTIDTSVDAAYATGSDYHVRMEGTTVDGGTINAWIAHFSIQNRYSAGALRPTTAGRALDVTATGAAGIDWSNVENPTTTLDLSGTDIQLVDTATALGTDAVDTTSLAANAITDIWAKICETEGSRTAQQIMSILLSALAGVTADAGATLKDPAGTNTRIALTIDGSNNRTASIVTPSS